MTRSFVEETGNPCWHTVMCAWWSMAALPPYQVGVSSCSGWSARMPGPDALLRRQAPPLCDDCLTGSWRIGPCWRWCQWRPLRASFTSFPTRTCCRVASGLLRRTCGTGNSSSTIAMPASCTTCDTSRQRPRSSAGSAAVLQNRSMMPMR